MSELTDTLRWLSAIAYASLASVTVFHWLRRRDRGRAYLAMALGLLGLVVLMGQVHTVMGRNFPSPLGTISSFAFMGCGYALLLFRHHLIPVRRSVLVAVGAAAAGIAAWAAMLPQADHGSTQSVAALRVSVVYLLFWSALVAEPAFRLWRVSRRRPPVQRARLRALALGYMIIAGVLILVVGLLSIAVGTGSRFRVGPTVGLVIQVLFIAAAPVLYASFAPPGWLRRSWREREEEGYRGATHELLLFSPDRATLAQRAVEWATRLVGADGAAIIEPDGSVLAALRVDPELTAIIASAPLEESDHLSLDLPGNRISLVVPMPMENGIARMAVIAGYFSPIFGGEEVDRLRQYTTSVMVALDSVHLVERVRLSEERLRHANSELERRVEERTKQLQLSNGELSGANKELEAFNYTVSHDLRAPLRVIDSMVDILMTDYAPQMKGEAGDLVHDIADSAKEMTGLIDDLLTFSQLSRQPLTAAEVAPRLIAGEAAEGLLSTEPVERQVEITYGDLPVCRTDASLLTQVYVNLLSNALKYTRGRPTAKIDVGWSAGPGPGGTYFVRDNGVGFDMTYHDKMFGVFQRLHLPEEYEGTGVGLAIVDRIIARQGGRVWAEGQPDKGATLHFTLEPSEAT